MQSHTIHDQAYEFFTWEALGEDIFSLAQQILAKKLEFDWIVALAKGGLTFSRSMVDFLNVPNVSTIQIEFYSNIGETLKTPVITQSLPVNIRGQRVLIFDDIVDSGETIKLAAEYLKYHGAASIHTSTLLAKPWTKVPVDFAARVSEAWVIFPNEIRETIELLVPKWRSLGDSPEVIRRQLLQLGFTEPQVALFGNLE